MTAATLTLAEFLLARIAEDEAGAAGVAGLWADDRGRVLAECESKRRIVEGHRPDQDGLLCGCCWLDDLGSWEPHPCPTIKALALPYADHPDFCDEWRP